MKKINISLEELVVYCKEKGFVYNSSSIYSGVKAVYDFGPLGVELKNNIKKAWWENIVYLRNNIVGLDGSILLNKKVVYYSGHQDHFSDTYVDCKKCKLRFKNEEISQNCKNCGSSNFTEAKNFNLMMQTPLGSTGSDYGVLRPETSQSMFVNFKNVLNSTNSKLPFGIAQIGKSFRNEVTTRHFIFRCREFEQMEMIYLIKPGENSKWFNYWVEERIKWWSKQGIEIIKLVKTDLAHYAAANIDLLFQFPNGLEELEGIHDRLDYDLGGHTKSQEEFKIESKTILKNKDSLDKLNYNENGEKFLPNIIEVSAGVERAFLAILSNAFYEQDNNGKIRKFLKFPFHLAPIKIAVIPLIKNNLELVQFAEELVLNLKKEKIFPIKLEISSDIGKVYKNHDEIGTPFCVTIDFETLQNKTFTVRDVLTTEQKRMNLVEFLNFIKIQIDK